jgi:phosphonate transport system ATP-binding protein
MIYQQFNLVGRLDVLTHVLMGRLNHTPTLRVVLQLWSDEDKALTSTALAQFDMPASPRKSTHYHS